ncbi:pentapeptide repeat-containing protein [Nocardioides sp. WS12]|uniref:pentapeptide repeat-containing protein n=1 Tax=Nocardioides sp. WS12 TaxID=2486272 RepID=UPI0015FDA70A|nr:pentapeptide repeat-containing protein [Nocardioides sp. WS12]
MLAPQIDPIRLGSLSEGDLLDLTNDADLESVRYADLRVTRLKLGGALVTTSRFEDVNADETDLKGARLHEVELDRVNLPVVRAARSQWRDVKVNGRLGSLEAYEAQWKSVHFVGCKLSFVNLRGAELMDVAFTDCTIDELDLISASARRVRFENTRIGSLNVRQAKLQDVDLRGATLTSIDGLADLRGATISHEQLVTIAPLLAASIGLKVE